MAAEAGALRALFDHCVPHRVRPALKRGFWWGGRHHCPVCGAHVRRYLPEGFDLPVLRELDVVGGQHRPGRTCPVCRSDSRTRLAWLYAKRVANLLAARVRLLHVAPEIGLYTHLAASANVDYEPGDLEPELYPWAPRIRRLDLTSLPYPDADFDVVIANHVLEHVADESRALAEIRRVLRPGGWAMLAVPIAHKLDHTREDPSVVAPESRERLFGQSDHLRLYGRDYAQRVARAGFSVELWAGHVAGDGELARRWQLDPRETLPIATRPRAFVGAKPWRA
jgi:SAM-dependent methyltransferase